MNHTIVVDEAYRERLFENRINAAVRRCKIGKVTSKRPVSIPTVFPFPDGWGQAPMRPPFTGDPSPFRGWT